MMGLDYHSAYYQGCLAHHEMTGFQPFGHNEISARFNRGLPHGRNWLNLFRSVKS